MESPNWEYKNKQNIVYNLHSMKIYTHGNFYFNSKQSSFIAVNNSFDISVNHYRLDLRTDFDNISVSYKYTWYNNFLSGF